MDGKNVREREKGAAMDLSLTFQGTVPSDWVQVFLRDVLYFSNSIRDIIVIRYAVEVEGKHWWRFILQGFWVAGKWWKCKNTAAVCTVSPLLFANTGSNPKTPSVGCLQWTWNDNKTSMGQQYGSLCQNSSFAAFKEELNHFDLDLECWFLFLRSTLESEQDLKGASQLINTSALWQWGQLQTNFSVSHANQPSWSDSSYLKSRHE